jgi:hypothetical protein
MCVATNLTHSRRSWVRIGLRGALMRCLPLPRHQTSQREQTGERGTVQNGMDLLHRDMPRRF